MSYKDGYVNTEKLDEIYGLETEVYTSNDYYSNGKE